MSEKNNDDSQLEKHKNSASQKKFDTLDFYKENLPLNAVEKLYSSSQKTKEMPIDIPFENNRLFGNKDAKGTVEENINSEVILRYIEFINKYNKKNDEDEYDDDNKKMSSKQKKHAKKNKNASKLKKKKARSQEEEDFLNNFTSRTGTFNYEYLKPKNPIIKILTSMSFIVFLLAIAFLCYKINLLNTKLINAQSRLEKNIDTKKELEAVLLENQNLKKTIQDLNNKQLFDSNIDQSKNISKPLNNNNNKQVSKKNNSNNNQVSGRKTKEYIVQPGDTLSSISKKFYGNSNSYQKIMDQNKLLNDNLAENQKLVIPD